MKKILLLFISIMFIPLIVKGDELELEENGNYKTFNGTTISSGTNPYDTGGLGVNSYVADSYVYEDGVYKLTGTVVHNSPSGGVVAEWNKNVVFSCYEGQQCTQMKVYLLNVPTPGANYTNNFYLQDGLEYSEEISYVYYSDEYEKLDNGHYKLVNPEHVYRYQMNDSVDKYICNKVYEHEDCEKIGLVLYVRNALALVDYVDDKMPLGSSYTYSNGKYHLQDIANINPAYIGSNFASYTENYQNMYTCFDKSDSCEKLYKITEYQSFLPSNDLNMNTPAEIYYELLEPTLDEKSVTMTISDKETIDNIKDTDKVTVDDPSVLSVKLEAGKGTIIPKKVGETDVVITSSEDNVRVIHVKVLSVSKNPNTKTLIIIPIIVFIISAITYFIASTKLKRTN